MKPAVQLVVVLSISISIAFGMSPPCFGDLGQSQRGTDVAYANGNPFSSGIDMIIN